MLLRQSSSRSRPGVVLLAVLVVIVLLTLAAYQYSELMAAKAKEADSYSRAVQARAAADSGVAYVMGMLSDSNTFTNTLNSNPYDNSAIFADVLVADSDIPRKRWRFSVIALRDPDDPALVTSAYRYGVVDETGRINVNALLALDGGKGNAAKTLLMNLPNMTDELSDAILDWIDPSSTTPRPSGAKDEYYATLPQPYHCKNGPLDSLEEMLLIKGVTAQLLFGNDRNRNGVLDPDEDDGSGQVDRGWSAYLTLYSREPNVDSQGNARIYLNDPDVNNLYTNLSTAVGDDLANYIVAYRLYGPKSGSGGTTDDTSAPKTVVAFTPLSGADSNAVTAQIRTARAPGGGGGGGGGGSKTNISSPYDLLGSSVDVPTGSGQSQRTITLPSPLNDAGQVKDLLPKLLDMTTTTQATDLTPRININTAPRVVLAALVGLTDDQVQSILDKRPPITSDSPPDAIFQTPAWLITEASFSPQMMKQLENYITARTQVYRMQVVGYSDGGGTTSRVEAVVDLNQGRPRVVYWRDLADLGKGFNLVNNTN
jgi:hypothetical protein